MGPLNTFWPISGVKAFQNYFSKSLRDMGPLNTFWPISGVKAFQIYCSKSLRDKYLPYTKGGIDFINSVTQLD
jgi:hypothetical protein